MVWCNFIFIYAMHSAIRRWSVEGVCTWPTAAASLLTKACSRRSEVAETVEARLRGGNTVVLAVTLA